MKFANKQVFVSWFESEISRRIDNSKIWVSPSEYQKLAQTVLAQISYKIGVASPYPWNGVADYGARIWDRNQNLLLDKSSSSTNSYRSNNSTGSYEQPWSTKASSSSYASSSSSSSDSGIIKRHNFDNSLSRIQYFSNSIPTIPELEKFDTDGGLFGWGDHYVNGREMNTYVEKVQDIFRRHNDVIIKTIREFKDVYTTFDFLDREYLQGILQTAIAAKTASEGAKKASDQAKKASENAQYAADMALKNEENLKKDVENLGKLVAKIRTIKEDLSSKIQQLEIQIRESVILLQKEIKEKSLSDQDLSSLKHLLKQLNDLSHLEDIDMYWDYISQHEDKIGKLYTETKNLQGTIRNSERELSDKIKIQDQSISDCSERIDKIEKSNNPSEGGVVNGIYSQLKRHDKQLILAYVIGGLGMIMGICSLILR